MATRTYLLPQVIVQQDFASLPASATQSLLAVIVGPRKAIRDIEDAADADYVSYGAFNPAASTTYTLKGVDSLDVVEKDSIVLKLKNVLAQYATLTGSANIQGSGNTLTLQYYSFVDYSPTYPRNAEFKNRDVKVGDAVVVSASGVATTYTKITKIVRATNSATAGTISADSANKTKSTLQANATVITGSGSPAHTVTASASSYAGYLALGEIGDTYTVECVTAGTGSAAKFNVTSLLGDNVSGVSGVALGSALTVGTRGLTLTISQNSGSASYVLGEKYQIVVSQVFAEQKPAIASGTTAASYTGAFDTIYEVRVIKGGTWAEHPQVLVTTNNGVDSSPAQVLTANNTAFFLGSLGMKAIFNTTGSTNTGLRFGDVFYIPMTAATQGAANKVILADPLPSAIVDGGSATTITVKFAWTPESVTVPRAGYPTAGDTAWTISTSGNQVTLSSTVYVSDAAFTELTGEQIKMPVLKADVYYGYAALKTEGANQLNSISTASLISSQIGKIVPENPLAYGVYKALQNSAGASVWYVPVAEDSLDGYIQAFDSTTHESSAYYIVPTSSDEQIIQAVKAHVLAASDDSRARERVAVVNRPFSNVELKYDTKSDGTNWTGYVAVNPSVPGQYDRVTVAGATFVDDGIRAGDYVRADFSVDALGNETYQSAKVLSITDQENLILAAPAFSSAIGDANNKRRIQIARVLSKTEQAETIAAASEALGSRRVINVWPDVLNDGSLTVAGYYGAAAVAGLKSGVAPHQPLTNVTITGFTSASRSTPYFTMDQLNTIAGGGTWIIDQAVVGSDAAAEIYNRHQLTTDYTDDNMAEISITTNLDSISKILREDLKAFIGQYNNHPYFMQLLKTRLVDRLTFLLGNTVTLKAGPQILGFTIVSLEADPNIRTRIIATIDLTLPYPVNVIQIKLNVI